LEVKDDKAAKAPSKVDPPAQPNRMVLLATEREAVEKVFKPKLIKATIDDGSNLVADPVQLAEDLKNNPLFTQMVGFKEGLDEFENTRPRRSCYYAKQNRRPRRCCYRSTAWTAGLIRNPALWPRLLSDSHLSIVR